MFDPSGSKIGSQPKPCVPLDITILPFILPSKNHYKTGEVFPMKIALTGITEPINTVQTDVQFDPKRLEVVHMSFDGSFATIFTDKQVQNDEGWFRIVGGLPNPGYTKQDGYFATVYFLAKQPGPAEVIFLPSSMVLANDGKGTNVVKDFATKSYLILPETTNTQSITQPTQAVSGIDTAKTQLTLYDTDIVYRHATASSIREVPQKTFWKTPLELFATLDRKLLDVYQLFNPITK